MPTATKTRKSPHKHLEIRKILKRRMDRSGLFEIRREIVDDGESPLEWEAAYSPHGHYIGNVPFARRLAKRGILPELANPRNCVCSVGYSPKEKKWFGWSHRAIVGFGVGDMIFEARMPGATDQTSFRKHGRRKIETIDQAREAAVAFAAYVS